MCRGARRFLRGHEEEVSRPRGRSRDRQGVSSPARDRRRGSLRPVRDAVILFTQVILAHPDDPLDEVSAKLGTGRAALVLRDGQLVGAITGSAVIRYARARRA
jgi:CBS domain-containing protein